MGAFVQYDTGLTAAQLPSFSTTGGVPNWQCHPLWDSLLVPLAATEGPIPKPRAQPEKRSAVGPGAKPSHSSRPAEWVRLTCPDCHVDVRIPPSMVGKRISCPNCRQAFDAVLETKVVAEPETFATAPSIARTPAPYPADTGGKDPDEHIRRGRREKECPFCNELVAEKAKKCKHCGEVIDVVLREATRRRGTGKSKVVAALLAMFLGTWGFHKFYLNETGQGMIYLVLNVAFLLGGCVTFTLTWLLIPILSLIAFIEGVTYLCTSDERFSEQYD